MQEVPYRKELSEGRYHSGAADGDEGNLRTLMEMMLMTTVKVVDGDGDVNGDENGDGDAEGHNW